MLPRHSACFLLIKFTSYDVIHLGDKHDVRKNTQSNRLRLCCLEAWQDFLQGDKPDPQRSSEDMELHAMSQVLTYSVIF